MNPKDLFDMGVAMNRAIAEQVRPLNPETILGNKPYAIDSDALLAAEAHDWDGVPDGPDLMSIDEAIAVLGLHAARAAKSGNYPLHADLSEVVRLLDKLAERS